VKVESSFCNYILLSNSSPVLSVTEVGVVRELTPSDTLEKSLRRKVVSCVGYLLSKFLYLIFKFRIDAGESVVLS
jgi:hypothetical protein